jgi:Transposase DDE domain
MRSRTRSELYGQQLDLATPKQWQELVPRHILQEVADKHGGDLTDGKLTAPVHFWLLLVGVLDKGASSLKDLISRTQKRFGAMLGWLTGDKPWVTASALSQRNRDRPVEFWSTLYDRLRGHHFGSRWLRKAWQKHFTSLQAIDSSTFRLVARLRAVFAPSGSGGPKKGSKNPKGALKIHQVYNVGEELPQGLGIGPAREHDRKGWRRALAVAEQGVMYLIDRGYCSFDLWWQVKDADGHFITPLKAGLVYQHYKWLSPKRRRDRVRDELVTFGGMNRGDKFAILRVVSLLQEDETWWSYVTNVTDDTILAAEDVAEIYGLRWRVELFFRHLKHTMNMGHWFSESEAGVQAQLYVALTAYVLSQVVLLWASRQAGRAPEEYRFTTVVHELVAWVTCHLSGGTDQVQALIDSIRRNAFENDSRRKPKPINPLPA